MTRLIKLFIWILVISGGIFFWQYASYKNTILTETESVVEVKPGANFRSVLIDAGASELFTKIYLQNNKPDFELQAGSYNMPAGADIQTYIENLQGAISNDITLTFLEGWNIFDIDEHLTNKWMIEAGEFISYAENYCDETLYPGAKEDGRCKLTMKYTFLNENASLEGFLYPDTYAINPNTFTVKSLSEKMLDNFYNKVFLELIDYQENDAIFDLVTLASIVEKEEKNPNEKSTVAGILKKRLNENWMIGADITVCYAHRLTAQECKLSVTKYLYDKNDYNTRQKVGLPAGPIWNPSAQTIEATLYDTETPYYYYLHDVSTGQIYYGRNEAEHNRNKQLYIR